MAHNMAAMHTRARTDIEHIICLTDRFFIVFYNQHGIALITQVLQGTKKAIIIALMQPDRRFVQNIKHPRQSRANLTGKTDTLAFAARQRPSRA